MFGRELYVDAFQSEIEVFDYFYKLFNNENDNKSINSVAPDEHLDK